MIDELVLQTCCTIREGSIEKVYVEFNKILAVSEGEEALKAIGNCLLAALRRQRQEMAFDLFELAQPHLLLLVAVPSQIQTSGTVLQKLTFAVCDRQALAVLPLLQQLMLVFMRAARGQEMLELFWSEWLNLAARMARRGWREQTDFLLKIWGRELLKLKQSTKIMQHLLQFQLHFVVLARWNGFVQASSIYSSVVTFYLLLLRRAAKSSINPEKQAEYLQLLLRHMRDIVANVSRSVMCDDLEIFRQWYGFFWQLSGADKQRKQELQLLLQLAINYWHKSKPRTSRRQISGLQDLLHPDLINEHYKKLIEELI